MKKVLILSAVLGTLTTQAYAQSSLDSCLDVMLGNGIWSLGNIAMFVSAFFAGVAAVALYVYIELPLRLLRWLLLAVGVYCVYYGHGQPFGLPASFWAFFGALGLGGFMYWSLLDLMHTSGRTRVRIASLLASLLWGYIAIFYDQSVVGFMAVAALGYVIASAKSVDLLLSPLGIAEVEYSASTTAAGFVILMLYVLGLRYEFPVAPFEFGALYISGLVFTGSLLVNTWSSLSKSWLEYLFHEVLFLSVILVSVLYGSRVGAADLVQLGGTFFAVWLLLKVIRVVFKVFNIDVLLGIVTLLVIGVLGVVLSSSIMHYAALLQTYTFF